MAGSARGWKRPRATEGPRRPYAVGLRPKGIHQFIDFERACCYSKTKMGAKSRKDAQLSFVDPFASGTSTIFPSFRRPFFGESPHRKAAALLKSIPDPRDAFLTLAFLSSPQIPPSPRCTQRAPVAATASLPSFSFSSSSFLRHFLTPHPLAM